MIKWLLAVPPEVGSKWVIRSEHRNPFDRDRYTITVLAVKEGWVEYKMSIITSSLSIRTFRLSYKELET